MTWSNHPDRKREIGSRKKVKGATWIFAMSLVECFGKCTLLAFFATTWDAARMVHAEDTFHVKQGPTLHGQGDATDGAV
jgi:hypothetical protein